MGKKGGGVEGKGIPMSVNRKTRAMVVILQVITYVKRKNITQKFGHSAVNIPVGQQNGNGGISERDKVSLKVSFCCCWCDGFI